MKSSTIGVVLALVVSCSLSACSEDTPAVCTSVDDLRTSVDSLRDVQLTSSGALGELESGVSNVKADLAELRADAADEFSSQIDTVQAGIAELERSLRAAQDAVSADTLRAAASAVSTVGNDVQSLIDDVRATC
jgi:septal ring factor EnvC (AmiA/AmiB activator)